MPVTSPNQVVISKFNYEPCSGKTPEEYYAAINLAALDHAMQDLTSLGAFKLWLYLSKRMPGTTDFALSQVDCANYGIKRSTYYGAKRELIEKGYLIDKTTSLAIRLNWVIRNVSKFRRNVK